MNSSFKIQLQERLSYSKEWAFYISSKIKHFEWSNKIEIEIYKKKPISYFLRKIYFLPLNLLKFYKTYKLANDYEWTLKEIEVIEKELKNLEKIDKD